LRAPQPLTRAKKRAKRQQTKVPERKHRSGVFVCSFSKTHQRRIALTAKESAIDSFFSIIKLCKQKSKAFYAEQHVFIPTFAIPNKQIIKP
jgi:hypothetical protein